MDISEVISLLLFCSAISFSPGPNTTLSTALAANGGLGRALKFCFAVPSAWLLLMLASGLGIGVLLVKIPLLYLLIKLSGVIYMLWLAYRLFQTSVLINLNGTPLHMGYWNGVLLQFLNIKAWMLTLTITSHWLIQSEIELTKESVDRLMMVSAIVMAFAFSSNFLYAVLGSVLRPWLSKGARLKIFNRFLALLLIVTAGWMLSV